MAPFPAPAAASPSDKSLQGILGNFVGTVGVLDGAFQMVWGEGVTAVGDPSFLATEKLLGLSQLIPVCGQSSAFVYFHLCCVPHNRAIVCLCTSQLLFPALRSSAAEWELGVV